MTYDELVLACAAWLNRADVEPSIPTFITLVEAQINRRLAEAGIPGATVRAQCVIDAEYSQIPDDLARPSSITLTTGKAIQNITNESFQALLDNNVPTPAAPDYFALVGSEFRFYPVPDTAYTVELVYQATLSGLSSDNGSNWLLADHPDIYLYGALLQSAPFLGEDGRVSTWATLYSSALDGMIDLERAKRGSRLTKQFRTDIPSRFGYPLNGPCA